ncbi:uncharacterized protein E0L32_001848 [Thyridium curvatum]|uniref:Uncharacterized protein n=1 Tax=Thyridium curvatum TaxID=1093900 RepID=A0A507AL64_9PEZI|nr:uncharacterized protein E0L32_001831 [Thyridium curvatum]XP_030989984.1 uncharacterized protein E0L32_001848 [Thyridium curvatum]TPX08256.1 hypothetical protein E0L32_001831 [Thyridium curvatum]TPX08273.1 hypothetical protein E0L32_001848 [Thyridium curvatum]
MAPYLDDLTQMPQNDHGHCTVPEAACNCKTMADPIAICGMALRLPGGIATPDQFWEFLVNKRDARSLIPDSRFKAGSFYSKSGKTGHLRTQHGYFLDDSMLGTLDTTFFSMSRPEVERLDPQQRLLLEITRECFDSAGETAYRGRAIGTYIGSFGEDWQEIMSKDEEVVGQFKITGYGDFVLSNRLAYEYDLRGPSMTIRTGCSAALVGLHEACLAIQNGDCSAALVGGVNLIMAPGLYISMSDQAVLSPNGSCRTFDASADGYARAEGVNMIYIKKLSEATRDGNPVRAIIRGTAANADGKTPSLTMPSAESHEAMIRRAYQAAGLADIAETAFVECHGTGTPTGDPIETGTIAKLFGDAGVFIGGCKPNVGHSEGASGITSLIKAVLALEHREIPPNIKFEKPNPRIPFFEKKLTVPLDRTPWPAGRKPRVSVNSFGIGGSNAHAIIDSATDFVEVRSVAQAPTPPMSPQLLVFSANTPESLASETVNHRAYIEKNPSPSTVRDVAYTLGSRRAHLPYRAFSLVGSGVEGNISPAVKMSKSTPDLVLVFTGQGAQWPEMGVELLRNSKSFRESISTMDSILKSLPNPPAWTILEEMTKPAESSRLHNATISQPVCTAVQLALVDTLFDLGVQPFAVVGHSSGEMAAAYAAGKLTLSEAVIAAYFRGEASGSSSRPGLMAAIGMGWQDTVEFLIPGVVIACENSPSSVTISGDCDQVEKMIESIQRAKPDTLARKLKVDKAYHSHHVREIGESLFEKSCPYIRSTPDAPKSEIFSTVTGKRLRSTQPTDAAYWGLNLESPVLFRTAVANLVEYHKQRSNGLVFLEVGPHSALAGPLRQTLAQASVTCPYSSCLVRGKNGNQTFLTALGHLWQQGIQIDFKRLTNRDGSARAVADLPTYAWHHDHPILFGSRITQEWRQRRFPRHELLGSRVRESSDDDPLFRNVLLLERVPWIRDHNIHGDVIFPCAAYVGMAGEAVRQVSTGQFAGFSMRNVVIHMAMVLGESASTEIVTNLRRERLTDSLDGTWWEFTISSYNGSSWTRHCSGKVCPRSSATEDTAQPRSYPRKIQASKWYNTLRKVGANYGEQFQGLASVECSTEGHIARAKALHTALDDEVFYPLHPTKIDFFLQLFSVASAKGLGHRLDKMTVPTFIGGLDITVSSDELDMVVSAERTPRGLISGSGWAVDRHCRVVLSMTDTKLSPLEGDAAGGDRHAAARIFWHPDICFSDLTTLVRPHPEQERVLRLTEEMHLLCVREAMLRLRAIKPTMPHLRSFHDWLRIQPEPRDALDLQSVADQLSRSAFAPFAVAMKQILDNVVPIFKGEVEPLEVLLPNNTLTNLYDSMNLGDRRPLFQSLGHANPGMRILEIGAGTGGTTNKILHWLQSDVANDYMYSQYVYTDISAGFFAAAQERFRDHPRVSFQTLDISKDPLGQGFEAGTFDLVIAANVLHATPSIAKTLVNARKLLRPDGRLYMEELCCDIKAINFIMGVLPGWWLGAQDGRADEPYVSPERWDLALREAGFAGLEKTALDCPAPNHLLAYLTARPRTEERRREITVVYDEDSQGIADSVRDRLMVKGFDVFLRDLKAAPTINGDVLCVFDINRPFFDEISEEAFLAFRELATCVSRTGHGIFWLSKLSQVRCVDPRWGQVIGTARSLRNELSMDFSTCEIDNVDDHTLEKAIAVFEKFQRRRATEHIRPEYEYAIRDGVVLIPRLLPVSVHAEMGKEDDDALHPQLGLVVGQHGRLDTLSWTTRKRRKLVGDEVALEVKAVGMNFKDVLIAMGIVDSNSLDSLGLEASGVIREVGPGCCDLSRGDRVLVFGGQCFSTELVITSQLCVKMPDGLSFEDGATMPCVFSTVIHGLLDVGNLEAGQTVLVHSACGGVGLAAIQICQMIGAEVFCTVSSKRKIEYLTSTFGIPGDHIFNSRDASFLPDVMKATGNRGVDVVLNSLSGALLHASWDCVAVFGKMIEIGKRDLIGNGKLALNVFELNRSYHGVDLGHVIENRPRAGHRLLERIVRLYEEGHIHPLRPIQTFTADAVESCFRYMQKGEHIGKIVVTMNTSDGRPLKSSSSAAELSFPSDASYLLVGGLGGLGRTVSTWMVERGARHLVYLSRRAGQSTRDHEFFEELRCQGCTATAVQGSVSELSDVERAVAAARKPLRGILNMSMLLQDEAFSRMTFREWTAAVTPKVRGTWNLHKASLSQQQQQQHGPLDFFLLFSSISGVMGQPGQANYAGANTFLDAFVQYRQSLGLCAAAVDIGAMLDHGYIAENPILLERLTSQGNYGIRIPELLDALSTVVNAKVPRADQLHSFVSASQLVIGLRSTTSLSDPTNRVVWKRDRRMAYYHGRGQSTGSSEAASKTGASDELALFVRAAVGNPDLLRGAGAADFVARQLALQLFRLLLKPVEDGEEVNVNISLQDAGLDSLLAVEMRSWWKTVLGFDISVLEMLGSGTIMALGDKALRGLREKLERGLDA